MSPIATWSTDDFLPEFGTLAVRDADGPEQVPPVGEELLLLEARHGIATIARAGVGWCDAGAGDGPLSVTLERWSEPPLIDRRWDDLFETPYRAQTDRARLSFVTGGGLGEGLRLGHPGLYRLRLGRTLGRTGRDTWLLQLWPVDEPAAPRWLARSRPAVHHGGHQWWSELGWTSQELAQLLLAAGAGHAITTDRLSAWAVAHTRPPDWLDAPLFPDPAAALPLSHPERDALLRAQVPKRRADRDRRREQPADIARQVGVPVPENRRGLLDLLVVIGLLERDGAAYRNAARPPRVQDVLDLPAERVAQLDRADQARFTPLAVDIASIALWTRSEATTETELADLVLAPIEDVREALDHAVRSGLITVDGDRSGPFRSRVREDSHR